MSYELALEAWEEHAWQEYVHSDRYRGDRFHEVSITSHGIFNQQGENVYPEISWEDWLKDEGICAECYGALHPFSSMLADCKCKPKRKVLSVPLFIPLMIMDTETGEVSVVKASRHLDDLAVKAVALDIYKFVKKQKIDPDSWQSVISIGGTQVPVGFIVQVYNQVEHELKS